MPTGAPAVPKTFLCERNPVDIFLKKLKLTKNPNVENLLRSNMDVAIARQGFRGCVIVRQL